MKSSTAFTLVVTVWLSTLLHAAEDRPKIGVVLGGGGALGFAHIGVLKTLEELHVPVDYIGGTSMGAIVAGMYACGMSPEEIEEHFTSMNWWEVLRDRAPYPHLNYPRKMDAKRFMGAEFGLKDWRIAFSPGMAYGQKLNNVLETFALNSTGITDFDQLNIPYRAVATDLRSGTSVALSSGSLAKCMRASMAVPGAFTPVRMDDMVLVDGGILNNIPVEVVKNMGADIIIAVDVGASAAAVTAASDFHSLGDVLGRSYSLMQRPDQEKQLTGADLVITPELTGSKASHFHRAADIIPAGHTAADAMADQLRRYAADEATFKAYLEKQRRENSDQIIITDIRVSGNAAVSEQVITDRIRTQPGPLKLETVREDLSRIHGLGDFQTVTYALQPNADTEGYRLNYTVEEKFWGPAYLHFGMKLELTTDAVALWSFLLNYTRTHLNALGGELRVDLEGGGHKRYLFGEWFQPISWGAHIFLAPMAGYSIEDIDYYVGDTDVADIEQYLAFAALDAGINFFEYGQIRAGMLGGQAKTTVQSGFITLPDTRDAVVAATTRLRLDQLDHPVFPRHGYQLNVDGLFAFEGMGSAETYSTLELEAALPLSYGAHTLTPQLSAGSSLGTELPLYALFAVGGLDSFAGMAPYQLRGNYYGVGRLEYRLRLARLPPAFGDGVYAILRGDAGNSWNNAEDIGLDQIDYGILAGFGADTLVGNCVIAVGKAESRITRFYFSIGNDF